MFSIRRREFVTLLGGVAAAWPSAARAQQPNTKIPRIGFLSPSPQTYQEESGAGSGSLVILTARIPSLSTDLRREMMRAYLRRQVNWSPSPVDVIVCTNSAATAAAISVTSTIPIVMVTTSDPVGQGYVQSLARPSGNVTGLASFFPETGAKQVEFLKEAVPTIAKVVVFWNPLNPGNIISVDPLRRSSKHLGVEMEFVEIRAPHTLPTAFDFVSRVKPDGLVVLIDQVTIRHRAEVVDFARRTGCPAVYALREFVVAGGLNVIRRQLPRLVLPRGGLR